MLKDKISNKESGLLFYGLTPPKVNTEEDKIKDIAARQIERLKGLEIDGLILYDIQDESSRNNNPRPFPFIQTIAPDHYSEKYLSGLNAPKVIYKSIGKFSNDNFKSWIADNESKIDCSVFVGAPSKEQVSSLSLNDAYKIKRDSKSSIAIGGVAIPERHHKKGDEHQRLFSKMDKGCQYFISQCVYNINITKDFLSDYYYASVEGKRDLCPIIFTLTPCGSLKTMHFMEWLGIDIPQWMKNDLKHSEDILSKSVDICLTVAKELIDFCQTKNIPFGFNIESVAIRKDEIIASLDLLRDIKKLMNGQNIG